MDKYSELYAFLYRSAKKLISEFENMLLIVRDEKFPAELEDQNSGKMEGRRAGCDCKGISAFYQRNGGGNRSARRKNRFANARKYVG